jgi:hypothetical protein
MGLSGVGILDPDIAYRYKILGNFVDADANNLASLLDPMQDCW